MLRPIKPELPSRDSMLEDASLRHSQVVKARRNSREGERDLDLSSLTSLAQEQPSATRGARQSPPKTVEESSDEWLDLARVGGILPLAPENTPWLQSSDWSLEQQAESLSRKLRLAQLERRQHLLSIVFGTLLVGTVVVCTLVVRHQTERHEQTVAQLQKTQTELRLAQNQQLTRPIPQGSALDARSISLAPESETTTRIETPTLVITGTLPAPKPQASPLARSTTKAAPELAATEEATDPAVSNDAPESTATKEATDPAVSNDAAEPAVSNDATEPATTKDAPTPPNLRKAIKSAVTKEAKQPTTPAEARPTAELACDKNDPLCGDLS